MGQQQYCRQSNQKISRGEALSKENGFNLANPYNRRLKRLVDISFSVIGLLSFPLQLFLVRKPFSFFGHCFSVLLASKTWVGYAMEEKNIPSLRKGVIACNGIPLSSRQQLPPESIHLMDYWYARDYDPVNDLKLLWRVYRRLGD
jgi:lipopolysaccharide/colanic/teichoic acid biosynthesis glycosyltransferase